MIALRDFENKAYGKIKKGQTIPERVLNGMDVKSLKVAGFIADEEKICDGIKVTDEVSFDTVEVKKVTKKKDSKK